MKLLLIYGEKDAGKTTTCRILYNTLKSLQATVKYYEDLEYGDFKAVLIFNGYKIAIYSAGDEKQHLQNALNLYKKSKCNVLVAAIRVKTHYKETLSNYTCDEDYFWYTLRKGKSKEEKILYESNITKRLLDKIYEIINL